jgi:hypothetical protein
MIAIRCYRIYNVKYTVYSIKKQYDLIYCHGW